MREEYEKWFKDKFGHPPMPLDSRVIDFCWHGYQAGVKSMNEPVVLSEWQQLQNENAQLREQLAEQSESLEFWMGQDLTKHAEIVVLKQQLADIERVRDLLEEVEAADSALSKGNKSESLCRVRTAATAAQLLKNSLDKWSKENDQ